MKVACIMMQKNEAELLKPWFHYHASIFEASNIYILDNGSTDKMVLSTLQSIESLGANVIYEYNTNHDFERKGDIIGQLITDLDDGRYDFFMPLDCDEFVAVYDQNGNVSCEKLDIQSELNSNINSKDALVISGQLFNCPLNNNLFHYQETRKTFFTKKSFRSLDLGYHWGKSISLGEHKTKITHFHFHNKPFSTLIGHAKEKLKSRVDSFEPDYLKTYNGLGSHMVRYFLITEDEYLTQFENLSYIETSSIIDALHKCHEQIPYKNDLNIDLDAKGYVDNISYDNVSSLVTFSGWTFLKGHEIKSFNIKSNDGKSCRIDTLQKVVRQDVADHLGIKENLVGFEFKLVLNPSSLNGLKVYPIFSNNIKGKPLYLNGAANAFVEKHK